MALITTERQELVQRGRSLEYFTIGYNSAEGAVSLLAGLTAGSVSLVGFGLDSLIEVMSGIALLWRLHHDVNEARREAVERTARRIVGWCFIALAVYVATDSVLALMRHDKSGPSRVGILVAGLSVVVMPLLARAKRKVAKHIGSAALESDSKQADFCAYLSAILLVGLLLNAVLGWWWADPLAALVMVPIIANEGVKSIKGKSCQHCGCE